MSRQYFHVMSDSVETYSAVMQYVKRCAFARSFCKSIRTGFVQKHIVYKVFETGIVSELRREPKSWCNTVVLGNCNVV